MDMQLALKREYGTVHVPAMELMGFNGNLVFSLEFIDNFYQNLHSKMTFSGNIRMTRLISLLDGDAKKSNPFNWIERLVHCTLKDLSINHKSMEEIRKR